MDVSLALNAEFIDRQYRKWREEPSSVSRDWRLFFEGFELGTAPGEAVPGVCDKAQVLRQARVETLIHRYRDIGHLLSCLDPLAECPLDHPLLRLEAFGLDEGDLERVFYTPEISLWEEARLRDIVDLLKETYCGSVGVEYLHLQDPEERRWLQERMESVRNHPEWDSAVQKQIFRKLFEANLFEQFLHAKYVGQKRFSIEGAETVAAMLEALVLHAASGSCREIVLGMAHRGRLTVQTCVLGKPSEAVFCEFEENYDPGALVGSGDVKYHRGWMSDLSLPGDRSLRAVLVSNPSHLESVDPVVEGMARARQDRLADRAREAVLPVLIHGDAAFSGQGVVYETLNLSQLEGYTTGGTLHLVINNQIGFTTVPEEARSTRYATDVAKMLLAPIFHVHGEDPEAAVHVVQLACDYRNRFKKDVVVDVICYRRYGHNEGDEPYYTQPLMYERIKNRPPVSELYADRLVSRGTIRSEDPDILRKDINARLEAALEKARSRTCEAPLSRFYEEWEGITGGYSHEPVETGVPEAVLEELAPRLYAVPEGFTLHERLQRILRRQVDRVLEGEGIGWATAELLAFATLLVEGTPVRLSGQDSRRGTFSQRHGVLVDAKTGDHHIPLRHLDTDQAPFDIYDSSLSENGVLGFEYGYAQASPDRLVIWEAQFGDFANNAQAIIDQYIASAEAKWRRPNGLVLLLPHGYEGLGPEHSSARLERFLQLCAEDNLQVVYPTTPAQYFHLLRRQMKRPFRKPLVVMAPKSLLRHPQAVSPRREFAEGRFQEVLDDGVDPAKVRRGLLTTGKLYYDLLERRENTGRDDIALVRLEQIHPFPEKRLREVFNRYSGVSDWFWVQEEPKNMGAWPFAAFRLEDLLGERPGCIARAESASPATGYHLIHKQEQEAIVTEAFGKPAT